MSQEDEYDDRPRRDFTELLPIVLAMILTVAAIALCFFRFSAGAGEAPPPSPAAETPAPPATPGEVTVGIYPKKDK